MESTTSQNSCSPNSDTVASLPENSISPGSANQNTPNSKDQIANAVKFLSHPSVRDTALTKKHQFLAQKGLTESEISEAFARCNIPLQQQSQAIQSHGGPYLPYPQASYQFHPYYGQVAVGPGGVPTVYPNLAHAPLSEVSSGGFSQWSWNILKNWVAPVVVSFGFLAAGTQMLNRFFEWRSIPQKNKSEKGIDSKGIENTGNDGATIGAASALLEREFVSLRQEMNSLSDRQTEQYRKVSELLRDLLKTSLESKPTSQQNTVARPLTSPRYMESELTVLVQQMVKDCHSPDNCETARKPLATLLLMLNNLTLYPNSEKYRKINMLTPRFNERFGDALASASAVLEYIGFKQHGNVYAFVGNEFAPVQAAQRVIQNSIAQLEASASKANSDTFHAAEENTS